VDVGNTREAKQCVLYGSILGIEHRGGSRKIVWEGHIPWRARGARAYNGGLGAEPEAESFLARERPTKPQN